MRISNGIPGKLKTVWSSIGRGMNPLPEEQTTSHEGPEANMRVRDEVG